MSKACTHLLIEHLDALLAAVPARTHLPALESAFARGTPLSKTLPSGNAGRFSLFSHPADTPLAVGAVIRLGVPGIHTDAEGYYLCLDPVSLRADMTRIVMTASGFSGFTESEQLEIEECIRQVLAAERITLEGAGQQSWSIRLPEALPFDFPSLDEALGNELAEVMPAGRVALNWRRIHNELQVALHACPVNVRRRVNGDREINGIWVWGGGVLPSRAAQAAFTQVITQHPVSAGLAKLDGIELHQELPPSGLHGEVLIDWSPVPVDAELEIKNLDELLAKLLADCHSSGRSIRIYAGQGHGRQYKRRDRWCFWRRNPVPGRSPSKQKA